MISEEVIIPQEVLDDPEAFIEIGEEPPHDNLISFGQESAGSAPDG